MDLAASCLGLDLENYLALREACVSEGECYGPALPTRLPFDCQVLHVATLSLALWLAALLLVLVCLCPS